MLINPVGALIELFDSRQAIADLTAERDAARAERDALLMRLTVAEDNYKFHFDMVQADDAWRRAKRERVTHGR